MIKAILDLAFVVVFSAVAYRRAFRPRFQGDAELKDGRIRGWAIAEGEASPRVEVQLYIDGQFAGATIADEPRPDLAVSEHLADARCGFEFAAPAAFGSGKHEARVYAVRSGDARRTMQLINHPIEFEIRR